MFKAIDTNIAWNAIADQRKQLYEFLLTLSDDQWNHPSRCDGWMIRDVVGHLLIEYNYRPKEDWLEFLKSGCNFNRFLKRTALIKGMEQTDDLITQFERLLLDRSLPNGVSPINILADTVIHEQDIRIPLNAKTDIPLDVLRLIFTHWQPSDFNTGEKISGVAKRTKGLRFVVTDLDLFLGDGEEVIGLAEDILLAVLGRDTTNTLKGEGAETLQNRR